MHQSGQQYKCLVFEKITALVPGRFLSLLSEFNKGDPEKFLHFTKEVCSHNMHAHI